MSARLTTISQDSVVVGPSSRSKRSISADSCPPPWKAHPPAPILVDPGAQELVLHRPGRPGCRAWLPTANCEAAQGKMARRDWRRGAALVEPIGPSLRQSSKRLHSDISTCAVRRCAAPPCRGAAASSRRGTRGSCWPPCRWCESHPGSGPKLEELARGGHADALRATNMQQNKVTAQVTNKQQQQHASTLRRTTDPDRRCENKETNICE